MNKFISRNSFHFTRTYRTFFCNLYSAIKERSTLMSKIPKTPDLFPFIKVFRKLACKDKLNIKFIGLIFFAVKKNLKGKCLKNKKQLKKTS